MTRSTTAILRDIAALPATERSPLVEALVHESMRGGASADDVGWGAAWEEELRVRADEPVGEALPLDEVLASMAARRAELRAVRSRSRRAE
jgi:hypothetical protein